MPPWPVIGCTPWWHHCLGLSMPPNSGPADPGCGSCVDRAIARATAASIRSVSSPFAALAIDNGTAPGLQSHNGLELTLLQGIDSFIRNQLQITSS
jgi:hypothetical protein